MSFFRKFNFSQFNEASEQNPSLAKRNDTFKKILKWLVCAFVFFMIFKSTQVSLQEIKTSFAYANMPYFFLVSLLYFLFVLFADGFGISYVVSRFIAKFTYKEALTVRAISYLVMTINYPASQGVMAFYLKQKKNVSFSKSLSSVSFLTLIDLFVMIFLGLIALLLIPKNHSLQQYQFLSYVFLPLLIVSYPLLVWLLKKLSQKHLKKAPENFWQSFLFKILSHDILDVFQNAKIKDYLLIFCYRLPIIALVIIGYYFAMQAFGLHTPISLFIIFNALIILFSTIPITPNGLGTGQALAILFFVQIVDTSISQVTPETLILSSSLLWTITNQIFKAILGGIVLFLKK